MIELNSKTKQDFLSREWVQKLIDAGIDMRDAKYFIFEYGGKDYVGAYSQELFNEKAYIPGCPTYSTSELLYKLHEWICPVINNKEYSGGLRMFKDAPFYIFYYCLKTKDYNRDLAPEKQPKEWTDTYISAEFEYPIESLASLLIQCCKKEIGLSRKYIENINNK